MNVQAKIPDKGNNRPALITAEQLGIDFAYIKRDVEGALANARATPEVIEDEDDLNVAREAVKELMAQHKRAENTRTETKNPYLDAERVVDSFFNSAKKMLADAQSTIEARAKRYLDKKAAAERERREEEARIAREAERKRQQEAADAARAAEEKRRKADQAAANARAEEDAQKRAAAQAEADERRRVAEAAEAEARAARTAEIEAAAKANTAERKSEEKPAELARTRVGDGIATLQQVWDFEVLSFPEIDLDALRQFFTEADIEKAIRRYVGIHKGDKPLAGVRIYQTTKAQMR